MVDAQVVDAKFVYQNKTPEEAQVLFKEAMAKILPLTEGDVFIKHPSGRYDRLVK